MKVYFYDELREMSINQLLDLLQVYVELKNDIITLMNYDTDNKEYYIQNNLYFYLLNITKIKNELEYQSELRKLYTF